MSTLEPDSSSPRAPHYRWSSLAEDAPMPLLARRRIVGEKCMISRVELAKGCFVPTHAHENEQMAVIVLGRLKFGIGPDGDAARYEVIVSAGEVLHLPSRVPHSAEALENTVVLDVFSPPSAVTGVDVGRTP